MQRQIVYLWQQIVDLSRRNAHRIAALCRAMRWWNPFAYALLLFWVLLSPQSIVRHLAPDGNRHAARSGADKRPAREQPRRVDIVLISLVLGVALTLIAYLAVNWFTPLRPDWRIVATAALFCLISGGLIQSNITLGAAACFWVLMPAIVGLAFSLQWLLAPALQAWEMVVLVAATFGIVGGYLFNILLIFQYGPIREHWLAWLVWAVNAAIVGGVVYALYTGLEPAVKAYFAAPSASVARVAARLLPARLGTGLGTGLAGTVAFCITFTLFYLRPLAWLASLPGRIARLPSPRWLAATTPIPVPGLRAHLVEALQHDAKVGIEIARETLDATMQFAPVMQALKEVSRSVVGTQTLPFLADVAERIHDPEVLHYLSASLPKVTLDLAVSDAFLLPKKVKRHLLTQSTSGVSASSNTPSILLAEALWKLTVGDPRAALETLEQMPRRNPAERQLLVLVQTVAHLSEPDAMREIAHLAGNGDIMNAGADLGPIGARRYSFAWRLVLSLLRAASEAAVILDGDSRPARSQALNRAINEVRGLLDRINECPRPMRGSIESIGERWLDLLVDESHRVLQRHVPMIAVSPYILGTPVTDQRFVGKRPLLQQLRTLWQTPQGPPVVMLYGQRRVGKTSLLHRLGSELGHRALFVYTNLSVLGDAPRGSAEILSTIASAISERMREMGRDIAPPKGLENAQANPHVNPYREFETYLRRVRERIGRDRLILALDEFEMVERWIALGLVQPELFRVLRSYGQTDPLVSFVFCGLPRLTEIASTFFQPLLGIIPIKVGFFEPHETARVLECPDNPAFPLEYTPDAIQEIHALTGGHPYLVQLMGHCLVSAYNRGEIADHTFTSEHVDAIAQPNAELFRVGDYYFAGVWDQVTSGQPAVGEMLQIIAQQPGGMTEAALATLPIMAQYTVSDLLTALAEQDIVIYDQGAWRLKVELMRRWIR